MFLSRLIRGAAASLVLCTTVLALAADSVKPAGPADWPCFRGPGCTGISPEKGLLKEWPEGGPKLLWKLEGLGKGFSSVSIVGGKIFTMGDRSIGGKGDRQYATAYDLATQKELWTAEVGPAHNENFSGPRCTPTVDGALTYAIGTEGDLVCVETVTGKLVWRKNFGKDFGGQMMSMWKYSESPVIDGDHLLCTPGAKDAIIVALDKKTGKTVWKSAMPDIGSRGKDGAGYTTMVVAEIAGVKQCVQLVGRGLIGVDAVTGKFLWGYNRVANSTANITTPVVKGDYVFGTSSYKTGSALLKIVRDGDALKAEEVYFLTPKEFENHHGGMILLGDRLYGGDGQNKGTPVCLDFQTGKILWKPRAPAGGSAAYLYADGMLIIRYESGPMILAEANDKEFVIKGRFEPPVNTGPAWAHPVIHDGKMYIRENDVLMCYDVGGK